LKQFSLVLNVVLLIAVTYLYYLQLGKDDTPVVSTSSAAHSSDARSSDNGIVYINSDSLLNNYDYFISMSRDLENKQDSIDALLQRRAKQVEKEIMEYQKAAAGMTQEQMMRTEEGLMKKQQDVIDLKDRMLEYLAEQERMMNDSVHHHLTSFLRSMNEEMNYKFILGYQRGSGILLANDSLDITNEVIEGINSED
jgi:outer membrane protein